MIGMEPRENACPICSKKPVFVNGKYPWGQDMEVIATDSADGKKLYLTFGIDPEGELYMSATIGDQGLDGAALMGKGLNVHYLPKFCPECGRQLRA